MRLANPYVKGVSTVAFVAAQIVLYAFVLLAPNIAFPNLAFLVVVLCVVYAVLFCEQNAQSLCGVIALVFTLAADFFLVLYDNKYTLAMLIFNVAQIFHAIRIYLLAGKRERVLQLLVRIFSAILLLICVYLIGTEFDLLLVASVIYFTNLVVSMGFAMKRIKTHPLLAIGLLLFFLCDVCVWAANAASYTTASTWLFNIINNSHLNFIWLFYIPSQVLLGLSVSKISLKITSRPNAINVVE